MDNTRGGPVDRAAGKHDREADVTEIDLHGYTVATARDLAVRAVKEAWEHGCSAVRLVHGARAVKHRWDLPSSEGYGAIKLELRSMLRQGVFRPYARGPGSRKHIRSAVALTIALTPNPAPDPTAPWQDMPQREYRAERKPDWITMMW